MAGNFEFAKNLSIGGRQKNRKCKCIYTGGFPKVTASVNLFIVAVHLKLPPV